MLTEITLNELAEIYVEFSLLGLNVQGTQWPDYVFEVPCSEDVEDFDVGALNKDTIDISGEAGSTHYWKSSSPASYLQYDVNTGQYYIDLYLGFCPDHYKAFEMIGYVDIILNASGPEGPSPLFAADNCAQFTTQISSALFKNRQRGSWGLGEHIADVIFHGPNCKGKGGRSHDTNPEQKDLEYDQSIVYPNPTSDVLHLLRADAEPAQIQLFHTNGQLILSRAIQEQRSSIALDGLEPGLYFLNLQTQGKQTLHKVMVGPSF